MKKAKGAAFDTDLSADDLKELVGRLQGGDQGAHRARLPRRSAGAALGRHRRRLRQSWDNDRAVAYRRLYNIPDAWGTAVNVQAMVLGNTGDDSGTGVAFTRDPATGENVFYGEFLMNAQGEDVVAGMRTPRPVDRARRRLPARLRAAPRGPQDARAQLRDMQDFEFTIENGPPLHAPDAQRQAHRAGRDPHRRRHGRRGPDHAPTRRSCASSPSAQPAPAADLRPREQARGDGRGARPRQGPHRRARARRPAGSSSTRPTPRTWAQRGEKVLLVRIETSPEDIRGMDAAAGHPHRARRHDLPRRAGRAADGQGLRRRLRGARHRLRARARMTVDGTHGQGGRLDLHRRLHRRGHRGAARDAARGGAAGPAREDADAGRLAGVQLLRAPDGVGRRARGSCACAPTPTSPTRRPTPSPSAPRASASAAPSTCSSAATASRPCAR